MGSREAKQGSRGKRPLEPNGIQAGGLQKFRFQFALSTLHEVSSKTYSE